MLVDITREAPEGSLQFDVCIVGSGPAGITLAREISSGGLRVCILEAGGYKQSKNTQNLNTGSVISVHGYPERVLREGRRRQFGGTANLWNHEVRGEFARYIRYLPLDDIDFESREWVADSGWPLSRLEIQPFYERAQQVCGIGKFDYYRSMAWDTRIENRRPWQTEKIESVVSQFGSAAIFLNDHRRELVGAERVTIVLGAVQLRLQMESLSRAITSVQAIGQNGQKFQVGARSFVLAAGGLENARILLLQDALEPGGLGNRYDMVGRCFMDHPLIKLGTLTPFSPAAFGKAGFYDQHESGGQPIMGILRIRSNVIRRERMLNLGAVLVPHFKDLRAGSLAVLQQLLVRGPRFFCKRLSAGHRDTPHFCAETRRPLRIRLLEEYYSAGQCGWSRLNRLERRFREFGVLSLVEQVPDRSNRVLLQEQTDVFGQRKIKLIWRWNELDLRSIRRAQQIFREEMAAGGVGDFKPLEENAGSQPRQFSSPHHFLGTTRMHNNPRHGVVDSDCRVHDVPNLFIAGSSVFPTSGYANPTLTIVALAIRLAAHLRSELQSKPEIRIQPAPAAPAPAGNGRHRSSGVME